MFKQTLLDFVENAQPGSEYGFPPTLNGFQRKLVHTAAEEIGNLDHESIRLKSGVKIVKVRRSGMVLFDSATEEDNNNDGVSVGFSGSRGSGNGFGRFWENNNNNSNNR